MKVGEGDWKDAAQDLADHLLNSVSSARQGRRRPGRKHTSGPKSTSHRALSKADSSYLAWSLIWVALNVRDAVLVDQFHPSQSQQRSILRALATWQRPDQGGASKSGFSLFDDICFMRHRPTGQLFIISREHTSRRATAFLQSVEGDYTRPLLVEVDEAVSVGTTVKEPPSTLRAILERLSALNEVPGHDSASAIFELTTLSRNAVGLAGWLLGYSSIYLFSNGSDSSQDDDIPIHLRVVLEVEDSDEATDDEETWEEPLRNNLGGNELSLFKTSFALTSLSSITQYIPLFAFTIPLAALQHTWSAERVKVNLIEDLERRRLAATQRLQMLMDTAPNDAAQGDGRPLPTFHRLLSHFETHVDVSQVELPRIAL
ncbi:unnamed protein product [Tilletia controversa]|uniref:Uncharacterized protein n=2 Tax=Tilletia caries TaxID=13290 RepID=A0A177U2W5_9BASI|nr:hypothetical protein A4X03_0g7423 [Tilletia caries]CAD6939355.1 unnamed protein product [Tilletia controversa]CAD6890498.1 unnamed protein product [Tilletia caries]CAD6911549.1 unnamed protein product [Tilletia caries]CAD6963424.1 unnamed protein product [Tilletia controversa]